jgi:hypothetical protein
MRLTLRLSPSLTSAGDPRFRLRFLLFDVRMCRKCDRPRFTFPVAVNLKRLAAPLCVFNFGIVPQKQLSAFTISRQFSFVLAECQMTAQARLVIAACRLVSFLRRRLGDLRWRCAGRAVRRSLVLLFLSFLLRLLRRQYRMKSISFLAGTELYDAVRFYVFDEALENLAAESGASHLAPAEENGRLYFIAFIEKTQDVILFGLVIVVVHIDAELDLFYGDRLLMFLSFALFLFLLVEILPVVHDAAHGRLRGGRNLNQIQILFAGLLDSFVRRHDAKLLPFVVNHADFARPNTVVGADKTFIDTILRCSKRLRIKNYSMRILCGPSLSLDGVSVLRILSEKRSSCARRTAEGGCPPHELFSRAVLTDICRAKMEANRPLRKFGYLRSSSMCRNIKTLFNFDPPVTEEEVRAASLQFVRKITGFNKPSKANEASFLGAVEEVAATASRLLRSLETTAPPKNREEEAAKARARAAERFGS